MTIGAVMGSVISGVFGVVAFFAVLTAIKASTQISSHVVATVVQSLKENK